MESPRQPTSSAVFTSPLRRSRSAFMISGLWRPPPQTITSRGDVSSFSKPIRTASAVKATRVAAASSSFRPSSGSSENS